MNGCVVVTGATGLVGSHLAAHFLLASDQAVICIARRTAQETARQRVESAITAALNSGCEDPNALNIAPWSARVIVVDCELSLKSAVLCTQLARMCRAKRVIAFWHCAANTKFGAAQNEELSVINLQGSVNALHAAAACGAEVFNHVSTAYVAGKSQGDQREEIHSLNSFNNNYECTKHAAEAMVTKVAEALGIPYRIFRLGVVIGSSKTFRASRYSGLYDAIRMAQALAAILKARKRSGLGNTLTLHVPESATVHLVPVDLAIAEMLWHDARRNEHPGRIVHVCSEDGTSVHELMRHMLPICGVENWNIGPAYTPITQVDAAFNSRVKAFMPYMSQQKRFLRMRARAMGRLSQCLAEALPPVSIADYALSFLRRTDAPYVSPGEHRFLEVHA